MFIVKRNNRKLFKDEVFATYEAARSAVRSYIRGLVKKGKLAYDKGWLDNISRNPTNITAYGFKIVAT
jgi:hypothetical protein